MRRVAMRFVLLGLCVAILLAAGCEPTAAPGAGKVSAPPPPPDATTPGKDLPGTAAAAPSDLPADLVAKIQALIEAHKAYTALAEKVQNLEDFKQYRDELSQLNQQGSDALDDVMIASAKLTADQKTKWETYMNEHVTPVNDVRRQHRERVERMLM